jgi:hypothetical protein
MDWSSISRVPCADLLSSPLQPDQQFLVLAATTRMEKLAELHHQDSQDFLAVKHASAAALSRLL